MASVADELKRENLQRVEQLAPSERVDLALELGDFDLAVFCAHQELDPVEARAKLRLARQLGRRPSGSARSLV